MSGDPTAVERAVVVQLLDRTHPISAAELYALVRDGSTPTDIDTALVGLGEAGVVRHDASGYRVTPAVERIDKIGLLDL
jgi:hypothetical protein